MAIIMAAKEDGSQGRELALAHKQLSNSLSCKKGDDDFDRKFGYMFPVSERVVALPPTDVQNVYSSRPFKFLIISFHKT